MGRKGEAHRLGTLLILLATAFVSTMGLGSGADAAAARHPDAVDPGPPASPQAYPSPFVLTQAPEGSQTGDNGQGSAIAVSNGVAAVSSGGKSVYIYSIDADTGVWSLQSTLTKDDPTGTGKGSHLWGTALALSDGLLAVGDPDEHCDIDGRCGGQVVLYTMGSTPATWTYWDTVTPDDYSLNKLGSSVALSQTWLIAGAPSDSVPTPLCAAGDLQHCGSDEFFVIYDISARGASGTKPTKVYHARRRNFVSGLGGEFGHAVAIAEYGNGEASAFISQPGEQQVCYVNYYAKSGESSPSWHEDDATPCTLTPEVLTSPSFGESLAYSSANGTLLVGDPNNGPGKVWVYHPTRNGVGVSSVALDPPAGASSSAKFGHSVALSPGSSFAVVGAPGSGVGTAYGFPSNDGGVTWSTADMATFAPSPSASSGSEFGQAVALDNARTTTQDFTIGVGAPKEHGTSGQTGYAYFFSLLGSATLSMVAERPAVVPEVSPGGLVTASFTLTNVSSIAANDVIVTHTQDAAAVQAGSTSWTATAGWGASSGDWSCPSGADPPTCTTTTFPPGASTTFTATYTLGAYPDPIPAADLVLTDLAYADWTNPPLASVSASTWFVVGPPATATVDVTLVDPAPPTIAAFDQPVTFEVTVTNTSATTMTNPVVTTTTPDFSGVGSTTMVLSTTDAGWDCTGVAGQCTGAELAAGATTLFTGVVTGSYEANGNWYGPMPGTTNVTYRAALNWSNNAGDAEQATADAAVGYTVQITDVEQSPAGTVPTGTDLTLTYTITNLGGVDARLLSVLVLERGLSPVQITGESSWDCDLAQERLACAIPGQTLAPTETATFTVTGTVNGDTSSPPLETWVGSEVDGFPQEPPLEWYDLTTVSVGDYATANVSVSAPAGVTPFFEGAGFTVSATNTSTTASPEGMQLSTELEVGTGGLGTVDVTAPSGWSCSASTTSPSATASTIACGPEEGTVLAPGQTVAFTISATGSIAAGTGQDQRFDQPVPDQVFSASVDLTWSNGAPGGGTSTAAAQQTLGLPFSLELTSGPSEAQNGSSGTWIWTATNISNVAVDATEAAVAFDPTTLVGWTFTTADNGSDGRWSCLTEAPFCYVVSRAIDPNQSVTLTLSGEVQATSALLMSPRLEYTDAFDTFYTQAITTTTPLAAADLRLTAGADVASVAPGSTVTAEVRAANAGPSASGATSYRFDIPAGLALRTVGLPDGTTLAASAVGPDPSSSSTSTWTCHTDRGGFVCAGPGLAVGGAHSFSLASTVASSVAPGTTLSLQADVSSTTADANVADNRATVSISVVAFHPTGRAVTGSLPSTGTDRGQLVGRIAAAALLVATGAAATTVARRRRS